MSKSKSNSHSKILLILHQTTSNYGAVGRLLKKFGYNLDICFPSEGQVFPLNLENYQGIISFGGPMSANDEHLDFIKAELNWIPLVLDSNIPFLGICLGAQLLAKVLGASVSLHPQGKVEIGYYPIFPTIEGCKYFHHGLGFYQWHREGFSLPHGGVNLARSENFPNQAFRWGTQVFGVQFHPEMEGKTLFQWARDYKNDPATIEYFKLSGAQSWEEQLKKHQNYTLKIDNWLKFFLSKWLT